MKYRNCQVTLPKDLNLVKQIFDRALEKSFNFHIDDKGTENNPSLTQRKRSLLTYEEAWELIKNAKPHNVCRFRDMTYITNGNEPDYYDFGSSSIGRIHGQNEATYFIFIQVYVEQAEQIFKEFNLIQEWY
jgi:hypothetical protein